MEYLGLLYEFMAKDWVTWSRKPLGLLETSKVTPRVLIFCPCLNERVNMSRSLLAGFALEEYHLERFSLCIFVEWAKTYCYRCFLIHRRVSFYGLWFNEFEILLGGYIVDACNGSILSPMGILKWSFFVNYVFYS